MGLHREHTQHTLGMYKLYTGVMYKVLYTDTQGMYKVYTGLMYKAYTQDLYKAYTQDLCIYTCRAYVQGIYTGLKYIHRAYVQGIYIHRAQMYIHWAMYEAYIHRAYVQGIYTQGYVQGIDTHRAYMTHNYVQGIHKACTWHTQGLRTWHTHYKA